MVGKERGKIGTLGLKLFTAIHVFLGRQRTKFR